MFVTDSPHLYEKVLTLSNHGRERSTGKQFWATEVGYKYKMSNIQAAIGCAQLERADELIAGKRRVFKYYESNLAGLPLRMNPEPEGTVNGFWMPTIVVEKKGFDRQGILDEFKAQNIDGRVFFWPLTSLPMFATRQKTRVSYDLYPRAMNLPSYQDLTARDMDRVISIVRRAVAQRSTV